MKKKILRASFLLLSLVFTAALVLFFSIDTYAASSRTTMTSKGKTDFGICNNVVYDINDYYKEYVKSQRPRLASSRYKHYSRTLNTTELVNYTVGKLTTPNPLDLIIEKQGVNVWNVSLVEDDPIIAFVDKQCFEKEGNYFLIGEEYGYYCRTKSVNGPTANYFLSTVLLFNITQSRNNNFSTKHYIDLDVISQNVFVTFEKGKKELTAYTGAKGLEFIIPGSDALLIDEQKRIFEPLTKYTIANNCFTNDNYIVAPVFDIAGNIAVVDELSLTNIELKTYFYSESNQNNDDIYFKSLNLDLQGQKLTFHKRSNIDKALDMGLLFGEYMMEMGDIAAQQGLSSIPIFGTFYSYATLADQIEAKTDELYMEMARANLDYSVEKTEANNQGDIVEGNKKNNKGFSYKLNSYTKSNNQNDINYVILNQHNDETIDHVRFIIDLNGNTPKDLISNLELKATPMYKKDVTIANDTKEAQYCLPTTNGEGEYVNYCQANMDEVYKYLIKKIPDPMPLDEFVDWLRELDNTIMNNCIKENNLLTFMDNCSEFSHSSLVQSRYYYNDLYNVYDSDKKANPDHDYKITKEMTEATIKKSLDHQMKNGGITLIDETRPSYLTSSSYQSFVYSIYSKIEGEFKLEISAPEANLTINIWDKKTDKLVKQISGQSISEILKISKYETYVLEVRIDKPYCSEHLKLNNKIDNYNKKIADLNAEIKLYKDMLANPDKIADVVTPDWIKILNEKIANAQKQKNAAIIARNKLQTELNGKINEFKVTRRREIVGLNVKLTTLKGGC